MELEQYAAILGPERTMMNAGRPAGVGVRSKARRPFLVLRVSDGEIPRDQIDLLPIVVHEGLGGIGARPESKEARAASRLAVLIEPAGK